jgi:hypothetical protein
VLTGSGAGTCASHGSSTRTSAVPHDLHAAAALLLAPRATSRSCSKQQDYASSTLPLTHGGGRRSRSTMARKPAGASSWPLATHPPPRAPAGAARPQAGLRHPQALSHRCAPPSTARRAPPPAPRGCWQDPAMPTPPTACRSSSKRLALAARPCH